jgi:hypothetical protein
MTPYRAQMEAVMGAVSVLSATRFAWFGSASPALPRKTVLALTAEAARTHLVAQLRQVLYLGFYAVGAPVADATPPARPARCPDFVQALSAANSSHGHWSWGWTVTSIEEDGAVSAELDGLRLLAPGGAWRGSERSPIHVGSTVELLMPKEQLGISPGFYLAHGNVDLDPGSERRIVRVYWNTNAAGAVKLMASLTDGLNARGLAFQLKVMAHPDCFTRRDAAVLYLRGDDFDAAAPALARARAVAAGQIGAAVPAFTKPVAPGVAVAENPSEGTSFGWHRCGLLAEAIVDGHERRLGTIERRVDVVGERFAEAGLSLDTPYLNPGATDRYRLVSSSRRRRSQLAPPVTRGGRRARSGRTGRP